MATARDRARESRFRQPVCGHRKERKAMMIERLNPTGLHINPAYSQGVSVPSAARYVFVGGQNGVNAEGRIVGEGDLAAQTNQALANFAAVLAAGDAQPDDLISLSVYI